MRLKLRYVLIGAILCYSYGCAPKSAKLQKSVVPPDKTLFETGENYLKRGQYIKSRLSFQTLINTYPDSEMASEAVFKMADSYYEEGGTENLLQAEDEYSNFIIFYPASPKAQDAQLKIIALNDKMRRAPSLDQQYSHKTLKEIEKFERQFPDSDFISIVKKLKARVQDSLAQQDYLVGKFYGDKGNYAAAVSRYQEITEKYKDYSEMDNIYFLMADTLEKGKNPEEAALFLDKIAKGYPFSPLFEESIAKLKLLGKEVPPVDTELAALNKSKLKPAEGFSPLKPFIDLASTLGLKPQPDVYKQAKKTQEAEKAAKAAEAEKVAAAKPGEGVQAKDSNQIEVLIEKNAEGEKSASVLNPNSTNAAQSNAAKKNAQPPRYKKKTAKKTS
jgi:outer membrane protein assembly factor BamD